jgi:hypothetical protein
VGMEALEFEVRVLLENSPCISSLYLYYYYY